MNVFFYIGRNKSSVASRPVSYSIALTAPAVPLIYMLPCHYIFLLTYSYMYILQLLPRVSYSQYYRIQLLMQTHTLNSKCVSSKSQQLNEAVRTAGLANPLVQKSHVSNMSKLHGDLIPKLSIHPLEASQENRVTVSRAVERTYEYIAIAGNDVLTGNCHTFKQYCQTVLKYQ